MVCVGAFVSDFGADILEPPPRARAILVFDYCCTTALVASYFCLSFLSHFPGLREGGRSNSGKKPQRANRITRGFPKWLHIFRGMYQVAVEPHDLAGLTQQ